MTTERELRKKKRQRAKIIFLVALLLVESLIFMTGFITGYNTGKKAGVTVEEKVEVPEVEPPVEEPVVESKSEDELQAESIIKDMSLSDMIYQMMFVTPEAITKVDVVTVSGDATNAALKSYPVGGIVYFSDNFSYREQIIEMISRTKSYSKIPLFIGVDEEGGKVSRLGQNPIFGTTLHPSMKEIGDSKDESKAYNVGSTLGVELKELGFNSMPLIETRY